MSTLKTRLSTRGKSERERGRDTSEEISPDAGNRSLAAALLAAFVADREIAKWCTQWRNPTTKAARGAPPVAPTDGADAAILGRMADLCGERLGKGLASSGVRKHALPLCTARAGLRACGLEEV